MPNLDEGDFTLLIPELELGDAVLFNFKTVHGTPGNLSQERRRAFSNRFMDADVRYVDRGGAISALLMALTSTALTRCAKTGFRWYGKVNVLFFVSRSIKRLCGQV